MTEPFCIYEECRLPLKPGQTIWEHYETDCKRTQPQERHALSTYYIFWRGGEFREDFDRGLILFKDGTTMTRELLMDYELQLEKKRARAYWNGLPWWKKIFRSKPLAAY